MNIETVKNYFKAFHIEKRIIELEESSATVDLAARALHTEPARIAKTLSFYDKNGECSLIVTAGDCKVDNKKYKELFGVKAKMLSPDDVQSMVGYQIGGVCPFGIVSSKVHIYLDASLKRFQTVFPACGSSNSAIELTIDELLTYSKAISFIDVCKGWQQNLTYKISDHFEEIPEAKAIRQRVFIDEQGFQNEFDETDNAATHIVAYQGDIPIATARLFKSDKPDTYTIGRVAVIPECRGQHIGANIMQKLEEVAKEKGGKFIELSAQTRVISFYKSLGYEPFGEEYLDEFCPHMAVRKTL